MLSRISVCKTRGFVDCNHGCTGLKPRSINAMALLDRIAVLGWLLAGIDYTRKAMQSFVHVPGIIIIIILFLLSVSH